MAERRRRRHGERGQVLILFALGLVIVLAAVGMSLDGGYGLLQSRRAQNAADFAAEAATQELYHWCIKGDRLVTNADVYSIIQDVVAANAPDAASSFSATYVDSSRNPIGAVPNNSSDAPLYPSLACGVQVSVKPTWKPFIAQFLGYNSMSAQAGATAVMQRTSGTVAIYALDRYSPHELLAAGQGAFNITGDIYAESTVPGAFWGSSSSYGDIVDTKQSSSMDVNGIVDTAAGGTPFDGCFNPSPATTPPAALCNDPVYTNRYGNTEPRASLLYHSVQTGVVQVPDPLAALANNPLFYCNSSATYSSLTGFPTVGGVLQLQPGTYNFPVSLSGNVKFNDCGSGLPGMYYFTQGLWLHPAAGTTAQGSNVTFFLTRPYPQPGNVPMTWSGSAWVPTGALGNGAPCMSPTATYVTHGGGVSYEVSTGSDGLGGTLGALCGGTSSLYGVALKGENTYTPNAYGTGTNFSAILGGQGTITLAGPTSPGPYENVLLYQDRSSMTNLANIGFDAQPGDSAAITLTGFVYDHTQDYGLSSSKLETVGGVTQGEYWDDGTTVHQGGTLQTGYGTVAKYSDYQPGGDVNQGQGAQSSGSVTVHGACIVDDFLTGGGSAINLANTGYLFPQGGTGPTLVR